MRHELVKRIKDKLEQAKAHDPQFKIFGASAHRYELGPPVTHNTVVEFERQYGVTLPEAYVTFLTQIGNGGSGHFGGAGPFYGVYALGHWGFMVGCAKTLAGPCRIDTTLTDARWREITAFAENSPDEEDAAFEREYDLLFAGLLPIGTEGCNFQTMLALSGDATGRIVHIDQDLAMPKVSEHADFLVWYEAWLDRVLQKQLFPLRAPTAPSS